MNQTYTVGVTASKSTESELDVNIKKNGVKLSTKEVAVNADFGEEPAQEPAEPGE